MFNLLVGLNSGTVSQSRFLKGTADYVIERMGSSMASRLQYMESLPSLSMPEVSDKGFEQIAQVGMITSIQSTANRYQFEFVPNINIDPIPASAVQNFANKLGIDPNGWELDHTYWTVKDADLFKVLFEHQTMARRGGSKNFESNGSVQFPTKLPLDPSLVAVMMPFDPNFDVVYETIKKAVEDAGLHCVRADDIWENDSVMGDISSLLWRARIIVADLTGKNSNVFYETGLAHALPRDTVLLTQEESDVPFDLKSIRYLKYGVGTDARILLRKKLSERLLTMTAKSQG